MIKLTPKQASKAGAPRATRSKRAPPDKTPGFTPCGAPGPLNQRCTREAKHEGNHYCVFDSAAMKCGPEGCEVPSAWRRISARLECSLSLLPEGVRMFVRESGPFSIGGVLACTEEELVEALKLFPPRMLVAEPSPGGLRSEVRKAVGVRPAKRGSIL